MDETFYSTYLSKHSGELLILGMALLLFITLLIALPQLLRANMRKAEMWHEQRLKSIEKGLPPPLEDDRARMAGRCAVLVPIVTIISAATVTSFLVVYKSDYLFAASLSIWIVAGVVSLAAITGGVALIGRLAQIQSGQGETEPEEEKVDEGSYMN